MQSIGFAFHDAADDRVGISYEIGEDYARARWPTSSAHGGEQVVRERTAGETRASAFVHLCICAFLCAWQRLTFVHRNGCGTGTWRCGPFPCVGAAEAESDSSRFE
jgi:hypothetical protein